MILPPYDMQLERGSRGGRFHTLNIGQRGSARKPGKGPGMKKPPATQEAFICSCCSVGQIPLSYIARRTHLVESFSSGETITITKALPMGL